MHTGDRAAEDRAPSSEGHGRGPKRAGGLVGRPAPPTSRLCPVRWGVRAFLLGASSLLLVACRGDTPSVVPATGATSAVEWPPRATSRIENLHALAKLHGYVQYFHPSDEAAALDWGAFAVTGVQAIANAPDARALRRGLAELFAPIAPTLDVVFEGGGARDVQRLFGEATPHGPITMWRHLGFGLGTSSSGVYLSARTFHSMNAPVGTRDFAVVSQRRAGPALAGKRLRLRASIRVAQRKASDTAGLWLRVDRPGGAVGFFDNMQDRPVTSSTWGTYEIVGPVDADAVEVAFGGLLTGEGSAWFDDVVLEVEDAVGVWSPVPVANADFEDREGPTGWTTSAERDLEADGYTYKADDANPAQGRRALRIRRRLHRVPLPDLWKTPGMIELARRPLGAGLECQIPLGLPMRRGHTLPTHEATAEPPVIRSTDPRVLSEASVIVAWNVFQHFYPYHDAIEEDWAQVLDDALLDAGDDRSTADAYDTMRRLVVRLQDGHGYVSAVDRPLGVFPAALVGVGDDVIVESSPPATGLRRGDALLEVDGVPVRELVDESMSFISGSPQWKRARALDEFAAGDVGRALAVVVDRDGERIALYVARLAYPPPAPFDAHPPIERLRDGVFYVDLERASWTLIREHIHALAIAPGVVFDLRGYPNSNHAILRFLLEKREQNRWMHVPKIVGPDHERLAWDDVGWNLFPSRPHVAGPLVFITDGSAISYAESIMGYVEAFRLGEIVGSPTAGANGNVASFHVPAGFEIRFTAMKVTKHDGTRHHGIGVLPTIPLEPTRAGLRDGRDEQLERALAEIRR